jgi:hypothetical protein
MRTRKGSRRLTRMEAYVSLAKAIVVLASAVVQLARDLLAH